jgi:hypothetical protein
MFCCNTAIIAAFWNDPSAGIKRISYAVAAANFLVLSSRNYVNEGVSAWPTHTSEFLFAFIVHFLKQRDFKISFFFHITVHNCWLMWSVWSRP